MDEDWILAATRTHRRHGGRGGGGSDPLVDKRASSKFWCGDDDWSEAAMLHQRNGVARCLMVDRLLALRCFTVTGPATEVHP
jgi:hypothetical protein